MNVLVACEESQAVCIAFRKRGHRAFSANLQECSGGHPEWHIQGDCMPLLNGNCEFITMDGEHHRIDGKWDLLIAHPPCTYLSSAGNRYFNVERYGNKALERIERRREAIDFFMKFINADCDRIAVENPLGYMSSAYRKPDQIIHPYYFAKSENDTENYHQKRTCLWLKGLPVLERERTLPPPPPVYLTRSGKKVTWTEAMSGKGGQVERAKARSKTFPGIAEAIAEQWGANK